MTDARFTETYVAEEPVELTKTVYLDSNLVEHATRDEALVAEFDLDLQEAVEHAVHQVGAVHSTERILRVLDYLAKHHPDMLRIMVGDRGYT